MNVYYKYTDLELSALLKEGDQVAYTEIYNRYHAALYIHVYGKLQLREESRDIVHDVFGNLWQRREEFVLQTTLSAYLHAAVRYKVFDLISHRETASRYLRSIGEFIEKNDYNTDHLVRERQLTELIEREIAALPPKMREVFELSRKGHFSHRQIAEKLDISEKTVKRQIYNSLKILRDKLGIAIFNAILL